MVYNYGGSLIMFQAKWYKKDLLFFLFLTSLFLSNQIYVRNYLAPNFFRNYLDDLLCMPLVLIFSKNILNLLPVPTPIRRLPFYFVVTAFVIFSVYFEVLIPQIHHGFTSDWIDVLIYATGCILFCLWDYRKV